MKERIISVCLLLLAAVTVCLMVTDLPEKTYATPTSKFTEAVKNDNPVVPPLSGSSAATGSPSVAEEVIRLHILADSDSQTDQRIKLALRDVLLPHLYTTTLHAQNKTDALTQLTAKLPALTEIANTFLAEQSTGYTATISVERIYFPIRIYGSQTYLSADAVIFPPGYYDSLQVVLGSGEGHNWWCLAYPSLCFIDASYDYIPKDSDMYKLEIGTLPKSSLEKLFYGTSSSVCQASADAASGSNSDEITLYFGSKFLEILKSLLTN